MQKLLHSVVVAASLREYFIWILLNGLLLFLLNCLFGSEGFIIYGLFASLLLTGRSIGIRLHGNGPTIPMAEKEISRWGMFIIVHSHHHPTQEQQKQEFLIRGKYYCAGCYGLSAGILVIFPLPLLYLLGIRNDDLLDILSCLAPFCFLPVLFNCRKWNSLSPTKKSVYYGLLPVGSWILLVQSETRFHNPVINLVALIVIVIAWNTGGHFKHKSHIT
jgi:hypothetical protein